MMSKPIAVIISDVHYNINTLEIADRCMTLALAAANGLDVDLVVAGDLHDTKANLRAECVNALKRILSRVKNRAIIMRGNHDSLNEKSSKTALEFLGGGEKVILVNSPDTLLFKKTPVYLIPYQHDLAALKAWLKPIPKTHTVIMHQGINGSNSGEYIKDATALNPEDVAGLRVISGHYHARQTIQLPDGGQWDYIGNPYTLTYGEAKDPEKGFQILHDDGSLEFVPTNQRKHIIFDIPASGIKGTVLVYNPEDLLWLKITGTKEELSKWNRDKIVSTLSIQAASVRIDMIPVDNKSKLVQDKPMSQHELLDTLIDADETTSDAQKTRLRKLWRNLI